MTKLHLYNKYNHNLIRMFSLIIMSLFLFMPVSYAESGIETTPDFATVSIDPVDVDIDAMIAAFYGDQADELKLESQIYKHNGICIEMISGSLPDCELAFSYSSGNISMERYHEIPLSYRSEGEGVYAPPSSKVAGKYTEDEAVELAQKFIEENLDIADGMGFTVADMQSEDSSKKRSRAYVISFAYTWDGIPLIGTSEQQPQITPRLYVGVTDEGIVSFSGDILKLSGEKQHEGNVLSVDELLDINPNDQGLKNAVDIYLCYKVEPAQEGRLAWCAVDDNESIPIDVYYGYDAYTGEKLT